MSSCRYKVEAAFPVWWKEDYVKPDDTFELAFVDMWPEVGGVHYRPQTPRTQKPDFSGMRLAWLIKHKYLTKV